MSRFPELNTTQLIELLAIYTAEYTQMLRDNTDFDLCKRTIDDIVTEIKHREKTAPPDEEIALNNSRLSVRDNK